MATERWDDDRLDRLAEIVEENSRQITANSSQIEANSRQIEANNRAIANNAQAINQLVDAMRQQQEANTEIFQAIVQEIRGLRAENRRILTHLFGEQSE